MTFVASIITIRLNEMLKYQIYITSDSMSFIALESIARTAATQFAQCESEVIKIPNVKTAEKAKEIVEQAKNKEPSLVIFSTALVNVRDAFIMTGLRLRVECVDALSPVVKALGNTLKTPPVYQPDYSWQLDDGYYKKIHAVEFAINNDDGKSQTSLDKADFVLIGVSRTSKTPLSIYLAYLNYLVVNIPLVSASSIPKHLHKISSKKIIGLTISPNRLNQIRTERNTAMGVIGDSQYSDMNQIINELEFAERIMKNLGCPIIDISNKAVEETAEIIMKLTKNKIIN